MSTDAGYNRVYIVEDEFTTLSILEGVAKSAGLDVVGKASSSSVAIQDGLANRPDLLILDILFPKGVDGIEVARTLTEKAKTIELELGVVFVTSQADPATKDRALQLCPYAYVEKPFARNELTATLRQVVEERRFPKKRDRRVELLIKENRGVLTNEEKIELEHLDLAVKDQVDKIAPVDFTLIESLEARIRKTDK